MKYYIFIFATIVFYTNSTITLPKKDEYNKLIAKEIIYPKQLDPSNLQLKFKDDNSIEFTQNYFYRFVKRHKRPDVQWSDMVFYLNIIRAHGSSEYLLLKYKYSIDKTRYILDTCHANKKDLEILKPLIMSEFNNTF